MLQIIGGLLLLFALLLIVVPNSRLNAGPLAKFNKVPIKYGALLIALLIMLFNGIFFYNPAGTITAIQYWWGGDKVVTTQGPKLTVFSRTIPMDYEISIQDFYGSQENDDDEIYYRRVGVDPETGLQHNMTEFGDAIEAAITTSVIVEIDVNNKDMFAEMADKNRDQDKLVYSRIIPVIDQARKNTAKLMWAQDYISGGSSDFDFYFADQLQNGPYKVRKVEDDKEKRSLVERDSTGTIIDVPDVNDGDDTGQQRWEIVLDDNDEPVRIGLQGSGMQTLASYGLKVKQALVTSVHWENSFVERLDQQKAQVAETQLQKQKRDQEYWATQTAIQTGEKDKAIERALLEKDQIKKVLNAETKALEAEYLVQENQFKLEAQELETKRMKEEADGQYYQNQKLVTAGLTPQERKEQEEIMNRDKWNAISKMSFDGVYVNGDQKGTDGLLSTLLGAEVAKDMKSKSK